MHWKRGDLPIGPQLNSGARSLFALGRRVLAERERHDASCHFHWVRAHTGAETTDAVLNAAADVEADRGARGGALPMVLSAELPALFFTAPAGDEPLADRLLHISGSVGGAFAANERRALLDRWARQSQGAMLRAARSPVLALMRLVGRGRVGPRTCLTSCYKCLCVKLPLQTVSPMAEPAALSARLPVRSVAGPLALLTSSGVGR